MTRRQAQQALATASALFSTELSATTRKPVVRINAGKPSRRSSRGAAALAPEIHGVLDLRTGNRLALGEGNNLLAVVPAPFVQPDSGLVAKIGSKISQLFEIGERIAAASQAKQLQVTVGLPWTVTVALSWNVPSNP